jgi:hypothetical protein
MLTVRHSTGGYRIRLATLVVGIELQAASCTRA